MIIASALIDICKQAGWNRVSVFYTVDTYGTSLSENFQAQAQANNILIGHAIQIQIAGSEIDSSLTKAMEKLDPRLDKIFVIFALAADAARVLRIAKTRDLISSKHQYLGVDGVMQQAGLFDALSGPENTGSNLTSTQQQTRAERTSLATGVVGTGPAIGSSPLTQQFLDRWWALNATQYFGAGVPGKTPNVFMPYAYDAILVYANALKSLIDAKRELNRTNLIDALRSVRIDGTTGPISFDKSQDRIGATYTVFDFRSNGTVLTLDSVGLCCVFIIEFHSVLTVLSLGRHMVERNEAELHATFAMDVRQTLIAPGQLARVCQSHHRRRRRVRALPEQSLLQRRRLYRLW